MKISDFNNSSDFESFCKLLFRCEWDKFQSPEKFHDYGIDGYIPNEKIFACYLPEKENPSDKDYQNKIRKDLDRLTDAFKELTISSKEWIFVTPKSLATKLISYIREKAAKKGLGGFLYNSNDLTALLLKHPQVKTQYPDLILPDLYGKMLEVDKKLNKVLSMNIDPGKKITEAQDGETQIKPKLDISSILIKNENIDDQNISRSMEEWLKGNIKLALKYSEDAYYLSKGNTKLQAIINIVLLTKDELKKRDYLIALCDEGITLADMLKDMSTRGIIKAHKVRLLNQRIIENSLKAYSEIQYRKAGYPFMENAQLSVLVKSIKPDSDMIQVLAKEAQEDAIQERNYSATAHIKMTLASTMGSMYPFIVHLGGNSGAIEQFVKKMYLDAKDLYEMLGDKEGVAYALHNLANNLRFFGEKERALKFAQEAKQLAEKSKNQFQISKSEELIKRLK